STILPVVHGKPTLVAMFVSAPVVFFTFDWKIRPVVLGMLTFTEPGIVTGVPGVLTVMPLVILPPPVGGAPPPAAASAAGWAGTFGAKQSAAFAEVPPTALFLHGSIAPGFTQTPTGEATAMRVCDAPPKRLVEPE